MAAAFLADKATVVGNAGLSEKPDALEKVARDIIEDLGGETNPKDRAYGFQYESAELWSLRTEGSAGRRDDVAKGVGRPGIYFWYRQSPDYLIPVARYSWMVSAEDPPPVLPGMVGIRLKGNGDLIEFKAVPGTNGSLTEKARESDWGGFFELARLDIGQFPERAQEDPMGLPYALADRRFVWAGTMPNGGDEIRVEAASYHGQPVYFRVFERPPLPQRMPLGIPPSDQQPMRVETSRVVEWTSILAVLVAAVLVARRSLRLGRSDRKGAFRLGLFILSFNFLSWFFEASHVPHFAGELALAWSGLRAIMFYAVYFGLMYLAFEPYIRRFWPKLLISWNRLLAGRFRDPSVGRDLLMGAAVGVWFWPVMEFLSVLVPDWLGPVPPFWRTLPSTLLGGRHLLAVSLFCLSAVGVSLTFLLILILMRLLMRKWWLWAPVFILQGTLFFILSDITSLARWLTVIALVTSLLLLITRLGFLAVAAFFFAAYVLHDFPLTANLDTWYWSHSIFALGVVTAVGLFGFFTSTAGRSLAGDTKIPQRLRQSSF